MKVKVTRPKKSSGIVIPSAEFSADLLPGSPWSRSKNLPKELRLLNFQLTDLEWENLRSQIGTSRKECPKDLRYQFGTAKDESKVRSLPYAFTREGANQLSTVLHSKVATERSIQIMRAFSEMERRVQAEMERRARKHGFKPLLFQQAARQY